MKYKFFDKQFLLLPDDEDITGKKVFYNDNLPDLIEEVEQGDFNHVATLSSIVADDDEGCCFGVGCASWRLAYYDPNYAAKVAYSQGKTIEYRSKDNSDDEWNVSTEGVVDEEHYAYRVKPTTAPEYKYVPYDSVSEMMYDHFNVDCIEDIKNCIWVRLKEDTSVRLMIIGTDLDMVLIGREWVKLDKLLSDFVWDDYMTIGK